MISDREPIRAAGEPEELLRELAEALVATGGEIPLARARGGLATWELRAAARLDPNGALSEPLQIDGGARIDRLGGEEGFEEGRFVVGGAPQVWGKGGDGGGPAGGGFAEWAERVGSACRDLAERTAAPAGALRELRPDAVVEAAVWVRLRGWLRHRSSPVCRLERGVRIAARSRSADRRAGPTPLVEWVGTDPTAAPWMSGKIASGLVDFSGIDRSWTDAAAWRTEEGPYEGPALLLPGAAARWVHEMAHAGLEEIATEGARRAPGAGRIVDDPRRAPWPFGYEADDRGEEAEPLVLWGPGASARPSRVRGHHRRASIRDAATPSLSCTWLEGGARVSIAPSDLPSRIPLVIDAAGARLEPPCGTMSIDAFVWRGESVPARRQVLTVDIEQGWVGSRMVTRERESIEESAERLVAASCTRLGQRHHVLVGAPTIVLDHVRL